MDCHTLPAGDEGSSMSAPALRGIVAISVAGAMILGVWSRLRAQLVAFRETAQCKIR